MQDNPIDILDIAQKAETESRDRAILAIRQQAANIDTSNPSGECYFCGDDAGVDRRFCNADCRDDWEHEQ
jgi:hypothetical protein